jgi:hypothetical protein
MIWDFVIVLFKKSVETVLWNVLYVVTGLDLYHVIELIPGAGPPDTDKVELYRLDIFNIPFIIQ